MPLEAAGRVLETDPEGYLADIEQWEPAVAEAMAAADRLELTAAHWEIIHFLRDYYCEYREIPVARLLARAIAKQLGKEKGSSQYLYGLFPYGPRKQASRYAGLPRPSGCF